MKRLGRWLFNLAAVVSLVLCLAACALWTRSHWRLDVLIRMKAGGSLEAASSWASSLVLERSWEMPTATFRYGPHWELQSKAADPNARWDNSVSNRVVRWRFARFLWASHDPPAEKYSMRLLIIPYWSLVAATAVLPMVWLHHRRGRLRRARRDSGLCSACGYDLRATPERCPECGAVPAKAKTT